MEETDMKQLLSLMKSIAHSLLWLKWLCIGILAAGWFFVLFDFIFDL
ncbi:MAG: hypothetical protein KBB01_03340 [Candidatus Omnitrophica bacterium]|jgi:hypothetical protein|nr:hypothetical protein [Candidatus Omnitrophota bacterium]